MKRFLVFQKKKNAWSNLETLIVLVSFLLTATDESASARNVQIACVAGAKRGGGRGEGERDPIPLPFFPSSLSPIPYPYPFRRLLRRLRSDSGDDPKENEQQKKASGTGREGEESPLSPSSFPLLFSLRSMASARSNAAIHKENFFIPLRNTTNSWSKGCSRFQKQIKPSAR